MQDNGCMSKMKASCWCNNIVIPKALIDLVPAHLVRKSCICLSCITSYKADSELFESNLGKLDLEKTPG